MKSIIKNTVKSTVHATAVAVGKKGAVLIRGKSGSGKSDLAFRLIEEKQAHLVCDDRVALARRKNKLFVQAVPAIQGLLEVRGLGILKYFFVQEAELRLIVDLVPRQKVPRMPAWETEEILGVKIARISLHAFDASAAAKIMKAIEIVHRPKLLLK